MADKLNSRRTAKPKPSRPTVVKPKQGRARNSNVQFPSESRIRVLHAARRLFARFGFEATSIRQIANELNIVVASLYHHFPTKEDMLHEIVRRPILEVARRASQIAAEPLDAEHRLVAIILMRVQAFLDEWEAGEILANEVQFLRQNKDFAYVQDARAQGYRAVESVLQDGIKAGLFRSDLDIFFANRLIFSTLTYAASWAHGGEVHSVQPPPHGDEKVAEIHIEFILRAIRADNRISDPVPRNSLRMT